MCFSSKIQGRTVIPPLHKVEAFLPKARLQLGTLRDILFRGFEQIPKPKDSLFGMVPEEN